MASRRVLGLLALLCLAYKVSRVSAAGVVCRDDDGNAVDWWYAVKLPRNSSQSNSNIAYGDAYMYLLSSDSETAFTLSPWGTDNATSMMGRTLEPVYTSPRDPNLLYVLYNDENPDGNTTYTYGHSKGDVVADQDGGFWLVHSVPKYPPWDYNPYGYPSSGHQYGQSYLCITIDTSVLNEIGLQFQYSLPWVFNYAIPSWAQTLSPNLYDAVVMGKQATAEPWYHVINFQSAAGEVFKAFAKHVNFNADIYADLVSPTLESDLWVETWNHGSDQLPSVCAQYEVRNIDEVSADPLPYRYSAGNDHSKWATAPPGAGQPWFCSGDNNRMGTQETRAGGTVCYKNERVWTAYSQSVTVVQPCI